MKKIYLSLLGSFLLLSSCTDLTQEIWSELPSEKYPENELQSSLITASAYVPLKDFLDWGGWWFAQEVTGDDVVAPTRKEHWDDGGKWRVLHTHEWDWQTEAIEAMYPKFYEGIVDANRWIEFTEDAEVTETTLQVIAELKTMRAFYYYLALDNYGDIPYVVSYSQATSLPSKTPRAEVFANVVTELEESLPYLKNENIKTLATRPMAFSVLAKLYLNAEVYTGTPQWAKAEAYCDSLINTGLYALESDPLAPFVTENSASVENIFTISFDRDNIAGFNLHMRTLHYNHDQAFNMVAGPWNGFAVVEDFFNSFEDNDLRKKGLLYGPQYDASGQIIMDQEFELNIDPALPALLIGDEATHQEAFHSGARVAKFEIADGANQNLSNDFPLFRYADILLMKAESMIRQGQNGDEYVNMVRDRAGVSDFSNTTLDQLLDERGRELYWEGHRRQDLIRFGKFGNAWWEKPASTADREVYPIPFKAVQGNPNLGDKSAE